MLRSKASWMGWSSEPRSHFSELAVRKSDFFRDLATADYMQLAEQRSDPRGITFDMLCGLFDAAILVVENATYAG